jgi:UDP-2-acetamido-3-amino-2,3-dideoxy-glucuronate N-acetyltransferase
MSPWGVSVIDSDVVLGADVRIFHPALVNIYGCRIGDRTTIAPFVEITRGVVIGADCRIASHAYICDAVTIEDAVFVGHGVVFTNDLFPLVVPSDRPKTLVKRDASIGSNATIVGGVVIGESAVIGAGSVVTRDIPAFSIATGNPARVRRQFTSVEELRSYASARQSRREGS